MKPESTKDILITVAGRLFAEYGYDGVSTRMIAERAGMKLSSIHYHFGSKENLYLEAFKYAKLRGEQICFLDVLKEEPELADSQEGLASVVRETVFRKFYNYFGPEKPAWETRMLLREIVAPSSALRAIVEKLFLPEFEDCRAFFRLARPEGSELEATAWSDLYHGQLFFYTLVREPLKLVRGEETFTVEFLQTAAGNLARALIVSLGLPVPDDICMFTAELE